MSDDGFKWNEDTAVVVQKQRRLAVLTNKHGAIVIRGERDWPHEEEDRYVCITPECVVTVLKAIIEEAGLPLDLVRRVGPGTFQDVDDPLEARPNIDWNKATADFDAFWAKQSKATSNAQRQRRYRQRKKDKAVTGDRNAHTVTPDNEDPRCLSPRSE